MLREIGGKLRQRPQPGLQLGQIWKQQVDRIRPQRRQLVQRRGYCRDVAAANGPAPATQPAPQRNVRPSKDILQKWAASKDRQRLVQEWAPRVADFVRGSDTEWRVYCSSLERQVLRQLARKAGGILAKSWSKDGMFLQKLPPKNVPKKDRKAYQMWRDAQCTTETNKQKQKRWLAMTEFEQLQQTVKTMQHEIVELQKAVLEQSKKPDAHGGLMIKALNAEMLDLQKEVLRLEIVVDEQADAAQRAAEAPITVHPIFKQATTALSPSCKAPPPQLASGSESPIHPSLRTPVIRSLTYPSAFPPLDLVPCQPVPTAWSGGALPFTLPLTVREREIWRIRWENGSLVDEQHETQIAELAVMKDLHIVDHTEISRLLALSPVKKWQMAPQQRWNLSSRLRKVLGSQAMPALMDRCQEVAIRVRGGACKLAICCELQCSPKMLECLLESAEERWEAGESARKRWEAMSEAVARRKERDGVGREILQTEIRENTQSAPTVDREILQKWLVDSAMRARKNGPKTKWAAENVPRKDRKTYQMWRDAQCTTETNRQKQKRWLAMTEFEQADAAQRAAEAPITVHLIFKQATTALKALVDVAREIKRGVTNAGLFRKFVSRLSQMDTDKQEVVIDKQEMVIDKQEMVIDKHEMVIDKHEMDTAKQEMDTAKQEADKQQFAKAFTQDRTVENTIKQKAAGNKFETVLEKFFRDARVATLTEAEMQQEHRDKVEHSAGGVPLGATPDLLLLDDVYIDGTRVFWIDAKSFYGSLVVEQHDGLLQQQASKYQERFGPGAFVFRSGACKQLSEVCGALVLDGRSFALEKVGPRLHAVHRIRESLCDSPHDFTLENFNHMQMDWPKWWHAMGHPEVTRRDVEACKTLLVQMMKEGTDKSEEALALEAEMLAGGVTKKQIKRMKQGRTARWLRETKGWVLTAGSTLA